MSCESDVGCGIFLAIGGPSGSGKSTIIRGLVEYFGTRVYRSITYTTRPPRKGEINGVDYRFVTIFEITKYRNDPRYTNFVLARGNWYWIDLVDLVIASRKNTDGIYLTAITQVQEFIERRLIFPELHWIWLTASNDELSVRLKARGDDDIHKSQVHNKSLEKQDYAGFVSLVIDTVDVSPEAVLDRIILFIESLTEKKL